MKAVCFCVQRQPACFKTEAYDKKHWNAAARDLFDSRRDHYALSRWNRRNRDGSRSAHSGRFDFDWQINHDLQFLCSYRPVTG